jgi:tetratricopeptide (TPR) repeat protein
MRASLIALVLISMPCAALAQNDQDWKSCNADDADDLVIPACTRLIETNELRQDNRAIAYYNRGSAHWRRLDFAAAIADENEAIEIDPKFANAYGARGRAYAFKGDHAGAIADFSKRIEIEPDNDETYRARSQAYARNGDRDAALSDYNKAMEIIKRRMESAVPAR